MTKDDELKRLYEENDGLKTQVARLEINFYKAIYLLKDISADKTARHASFKHMEGSVGEHIDSLLKEFKGEL